MRDRHSAIHYCDLHASRREIQDALEFFEKRNTVPAIWKCADLTDRNLIILQSACRKGDVDTIGRALVGFCHLTDGVFRALEITSIFGATPQREPGKYRG